MADNLSPYIDAAPLEEQKYFLATQQVDEARHAVFFHRFMHEVVGIGDGSLGSGLRSTAQELSWGHRKTFGRLDRIADELRGDHSPRMLAKAVTMYHIVVKGTSRSPASTSSRPRWSAWISCPAFARDAQRRDRRTAPHRVRRQAARRPVPRRSARYCSDAIVDLIREIMQYTLSVPIPPNWDRTYTESFGYSMEDLFEEGARANEARLRAIGLPLDDIAHFPFPMDVPPRERGEIALTLLRAGLLGQGSGRPVSRDPTTMRLFFDLLARNVRGHEVPHGTTIQWDFTDMDPWYLLINGDTKTAIQGRTAKPTVRLRMRYDDFGELVSERAQPHRLVLSGRLRPWGDPRILLKLQRLFH